MLLSQDGIGLERERWDPSLSLIMHFPRCVFRLCNQTRICRVMQPDYATRLCNKTTYVITQYSKRYDANIEFDSGVRPFWQSPPRT